MNEQKHYELTKDKVREKYYQAKSFCKEHKKDLIYGISFTAMGAFSICIYGKCKNYKEIIAVQDEIISKQSNRIISLENLCEIKDDFFKKAISDDLRHSGSFGAQQMAYKKWS